jgi:hypothetical protein
MSEQPKKNLSPKQLEGEEKAIDELAKKEGIPHAAAAARRETARHNEAEEKKRKADSGKPIVSPDTSSPPETT